MILTPLLVGALGGHQVTAYSSATIRCGYSFRRSTAQAKCFRSRSYVGVEREVLGPWRASRDESFDEIFEPAEGNDNSLSDTSLREALDQDDDDEINDDEDSVPTRDIAASSQFESRIPQLNIVTLSGRVGNDPEPKYFDNGNVVVNLSLAVKRKYHPLERKARNIRSGEEETDWFPLEIWGQNAEYVARYVDKGSRIGITGSLLTDRWTDRNTGEDRTRPKIRVRHLDILETKAEADLRRKKSGGGGGGNGGMSGNRGRQARDRFDENTYNDKEDDWRQGPSPAGTGGFFDP